MKLHVVFAVAALPAVLLVPSVPALSLTFCTFTDTQNPHFFDLSSGVGVATSQGEIGAFTAFAFSANNAPCDQIGSDGDNEQGVGGAQMPIAGATCHYSQDQKNSLAGDPLTITVGHHGDDIYVAQNTAGLDVVWASGIDGEDPAALIAGAPCVGNGIITDDAVTDPADCLDSTGANINFFGSVHSDTDPLSAGSGGQFGLGPGTNDPHSGYTCFDAVDGNEWTFLTVGPFATTIPGEGAVLGVEQLPELGNGPWAGLATGGHGGAFVELNTDGAGSSTCPTLIDASDGDDGSAPACFLTVDPDWTPPMPTGVFGFSLPISGTIASGVEE
jgi:hypothetical protein